MLDPLKNTALPPTPAVWGSPDSGGTFIFKEHAVLETWMSPVDPVRHIARTARTCYKSSKTGGELEMVRSLANKGHFAMLEFASAGVRLETSRDVTHELVRHRLASFAQESQRYVDGTKEPIAFILPHWMSERDKFILKENPGETPSPRADLFMGFCRRAVDAYTLLRRDYGLAPQDARVVLPNCTATTIVMQANLREWLHIFALRYEGRTGAPYPPMKSLMADVFARFDMLLGGGLLDELCRVAV